MLCLTAFFGMSVSAAEEFVEGYYTYTVADGKATIVSVDSRQAGDITVPSSLGGYPVTVIGENAFIHNNSITSVTISEGIEVILNHAFFDCSKLKEIKISATVKSIDGENVFSLSGALDSILVDDDNVFFSSDDNGILYNKDKTSLIKFPEGIRMTEFVIPSTVENIQGYAFSGCDLINIVVSDNVKTIGKRTFARCELLEKIYVGKSVSDIGLYAFNDSPKLRLEVDVDNEYFSTDENNDVLFDKNKTKLIKHLRGTELVNYDIPLTVTEIGEFAFEGCSSLKSIDLHEGMTALGSSAFWGCESITEIIIPSTVLTVGSGGAFSNCKNLIKVVLADGMTNVPSKVCYNLSTVEEIIVPNTVVSIGNYAFYQCLSLEELVLPESIIEIGNSAFLGCSKLKLIELHKGIKNIGNSAFENCSSLKEIAIPSTVTVISYSCFRRCDSLETLKIPAGVIRIAGNALDGCNNLTNVYYGGNSEQWSVVSGTEYVESCPNAEIHCAVETGSCGADGDNVTYIIYDNGLLDISGTGNMKNYDNSSVSPFKGNLLISSVLIEEGVTRLSSDAFFNCTNLEKIDLPVSLLSVYSSSFSGCEKLKNIYLPEGVQNVYLSSETCLSLETFTVDEKNAFYSAYEGVLYNKDKTQILSYPAAKDSRFFKIMEGVTTVGAYCFINNSFIEMVELAESLTTLSSRIFDGCDKIENIFILENVTTIEADAFINCESLNAIDVDSENQYFTSDDGVLYNKNKTIILKYPQGKTFSSYNIADTVTFIGEYSFDGCKNLESVIIPVGVASIGDRAFYHCTNLEEVYLPETVTKIGILAFSSCESLNNIDLHEGLKSIGRSAFSNCTTFTEILIPSTLNNISGVTTLDVLSGVFAGCENVRKVVFAEGTEVILNTICAGLTSLESVSIPSTVKIIEGTAFNDCINLKSINLNEGLLEIGSLAFRNCKSLEEITFPSTLEKMANGTFFAAFSSCSNLKTVNFAVGTTKIVNYACSKMYNLETVNIPYTVTEIEPYAFSGSFNEYENIKEINIYNKDFEFTNTLPKNGVIKGFANSTAQTYAETNDRVFEPLFGGLTYEYEDGVLVLTGSDAVLDLTDASYYPWSQYSALTYELILDGVNSVGENAFANFENLRSVIIDGKTTIITDDYQKVYEFSDAEIKSGAFSGCKNLSLIVSYADTDVADNAITENFRPVKYFIDVNATNKSDIGFITFGFVNDEIDYGDFKIDTYKTLVDGEVSFTEEEFKLFISALYYGSDNNFVNIVFNRMTAEDFYIYEYTSLNPLQGKEIREVSGAKIFAIIKIAPDSGEYMSLTMENFCDVLSNDKFEVVDFKFAIMGKSEMTDDEVNNEETEEEEEPSIIMGFFASILEGIAKIFKFFKSFFGKG